MTIKTAKGKIYQTDYVTNHRPSNSVFIRIIGADDNEVEKVFSDPEETTILEYGNTRLEGFTVFDGVDDEGDALKVRLIHG